MACNCNEEVNESLAKFDGRLAFGFAIGRSTDGSLSRMRETILIQTEKTDKKSRKRIPAVIPTFCPFCGLKYETSAD